MVAASYVQPSFLGGEWSKFAQGRMDNPRYKTALARCLNGYPTEEGAWRRRPGFRHVAPTRAGALGQLLPFEFEASSPYNMELTAGHMRLHSGAVVVTETPVAVTTISSATPAVLETGSATTWATNDYALFNLGDAPTKRALPKLSNRQFRITKIDTTHFQLYDAVTGVAIDGAALGWTTGHAVTVSKIVDFSTPYTEEQVEDVQSVQTQGLALLLHGDEEPRSLELTQEPELGQFAQFEFDQAFFQDGPYLDPFPNSVITPSGTNGIITLTLSYTAYSATKAYREDDFVTDGGISYRSLQDQNVGNTPATSAAFWVVASPGEAVGPSGFQLTDIGRLIRLFSNNAAWSWGRIVAMSSTGLIPSSTGTIGSNMTNDTNAFDGNTATVATRSVQLNTNVGQIGFGAFAGKDFGVAGAQVVGTVVAYPDTTLGFLQGSGPVPFTVTLYGSNTSMSTIGATILATANLDQDQTTPVTLVSTDQANAYRYVWVAIDGATAPNQGTLFVTMCLAEIQMNTPSAAAGIAVSFQVLGDPLVNTSAITVWRLGVYSDTTGWPKCGCYHEGRLWLSGAVKNRIDSSVSNGIIGNTINMAPTSSTGVVADSNAITYTFNTAKVNPIFWMKPNDQGIICGTKGGEVLVRASENGNKLTPTSIQAHEVTSYGCADVAPAKIGLSTVFVQSFKRRLMEFVSDAYSGKFFGPNLSELAKHLTKSGLQQIVAQEELTPIVWGRRGDGDLVGCTYRRVSLLSSEEPKFLGWHRHELGSGRSVVSVCVGPSVGGDLDALSVITKDGNNIHHVEILTDLFDENDPIESAWFLDNSIVPSAAENVTLTNGRPGMRFHGLWHLNDLKVSVFAGGIDCGDFIVTNGYVDVPYGSGFGITDGSGLFTTALVNTLTVEDEDYGDLEVGVDGGALRLPCVVGFTYVSQGQTLRPFSAADTGSRNGPGFAKEKRTQEAGFLMESTQGIYFGTVLEDNSGEKRNMQPAKLATKGGTPLARNVLFSGIHLPKLDDAYSLDSMLAWEISRPYPANIMACGGFLATQDKG